MWRRFFRTEGMTFGTRMAITAVVMADHRRRHSAMEERIEANRSAWKRLADTGERAKLVEAAWASVVGAGLAHEHAASAARKELEKVGEALRRCARRPRGGERSTGASTVKVVIFGNGPFASLAWYVLTHDSEHEVAGFTVDGDYRRENSLHGLPVVPFEEVTTHFPPVRFAMIAPLGFQQLNGLRKAKHEQGRFRGYRFISCVSSKSITWPDLNVGENSMIFEGAIVQPFAQLGRGVIVRAGVSIGHHCAIEEYCFMAAGAVIGGRARIGAQCLLGLNATIRDGVCVAARCVIGAGAAVTEDTEEDGVYMGVPAKRTSIPLDVVTASVSRSS